jgi:hypothetical protein
MPLITPQRQPLLTGHTLQFTTTAPNPVTWAASFGSITSAGLYTAPMTPGPALVSCTSNGETFYAAALACEEFRWCGSYGQQGQAEIAGKISLAMDRSRQVRRRGNLKRSWKLQMRLEDQEFNEFLTFYDDMHLHLPFWFDDQQTQLKGFFWFDGPVEYTLNHVLTWDVTTPIAEF